MATTTVRVCDMDQGACKRPATCYKMWRDGDRQAWAVDLCDEHSAPLLAIVQLGELQDLPTKPRVRMEPTQLRTTERTAHLKKE